MRDLTKCLYYRSGLIILRSLKCTIPCIHSVCRSEKAKDSIVVTVFQNSAKRRVFQCHGITLFVFAVMHFCGTQTDSINIAKLYSVYPTKKPVIHFKDSSAG